MTAPDQIVRGRRVVTDHEIGAASVHIRGGVILKVSAYDDVPPGCTVDDAGDHVLMPGIVDTHVHINDPGRADWEGFDSATRAAAAGGVTTLVDMPLNSIPPTTTIAGLESKVLAAQNRCWVDVGFCGGVVPGNTTELRSLRDAGVLAFKCFLAETGVAEFSHVDEPELTVAMRTLADIGVPLLVHAELPGPLDMAASTQGIPDEEASKLYRTFLASRPREAENQAVALVIRLSAEFGTRAHIVHLSSSDALESLRRAREAHTRITAETCPHYLHFTSEQIPDGATEYKCTPPIRERENRERLWDALREGLLDQVVTDHSPATPDLKCIGSGDFTKAWGGISSLQLGLAVVWTEARSRGRSIHDLVEWMSHRPAMLVGLDQRKGAIKPGCDADLVAWDPDAEFRVDPALVHHRHKLTPYRGQQLHGVVSTTWLRGAKIFDRGRFASSPTGQWLKGSRGH